MWKFIIHAITPVPFHGFAKFRNCEHDLLADERHTKKFFYTVLRSMNNLQQIHTAGCILPPTPVVVHTKARFLHIQERAPKFVPISGFSILY